MKAVELSHQTHRSVKAVAEALDIHPFMLSRWHKEYREETFPIKLVKKAPVETKQKIQEQDKVIHLKRRISKLQEENYILKKFQRYQAEERRKSSGSSENTEGNTE